MILKCMTFLQTNNVLDTKVSGSNQEEASSNVGDENDDEDVKEQIGESDQSASNV